MTTKTVNLTPADLLKIVEWISTFETAPRVIQIITQSTGIGTAVRVEVETKEGEGRWKDITDYENW